VWATKRAVVEPVDRLSAKRRSSGSAITANRNQGAVDEGKEMETQQQEALKQLSAAAEAAGKALAVKLTPLCLAFGQLARQIHASLWYAYVMDGAPYGETSRGLERWVRETSERMRAEHDADINEQWQELLSRARGWRK
jgi:hypothetical protein